ncbi:MAG: uncharacterized protein KVP18_001781 [Porospora cf. gigantea A]|uniref:uncharacterized protein n=1 Tax=Porospora cf. gigantea A TaxID=2853593 RepID=UPI003559490D|nr:MAG: hypothetical protein KVP18_001781 [Porospora cf. gigantea A]
MTLCQLDVDVDGEVTHLVLRLLENAAPETCSNFRRICDGSAQQSFDGCLFETIIPGSLMRTQRPQGATTSVSSRESRTKRAKRGDALLGSCSQLTIMLGSECEIDDDQRLLGEIVDLHALEEVERVYADGVKVKLMKCELASSDTLTTRDEKGRICKGRGFLKATRRVPERYEDGWIGVAVKRREDRSVARRRWRSRSAEGPAASRRQHSRRSPLVNSRRSPIRSLSKQREVRIERRRARSISPRPNDRSRTETRRHHRYRGRNRSRSRSRSMNEPGMRTSPPPTKRPSRTIHVHSSRPKRADRKGWSGSGSKNEVVPLLDT